MNRTLNLGNPFMTMRPNFFSLGGIVLALAGGFALCQTMPATNAKQDPKLTFSVAAAEKPQDVAPSVARVASDTVQLAGTISTPNPCYEVKGTLSSDSRQLTLSIVATSKGGFCIQMLAAFEYTATITDIASGSYTISVVHDYPDSGWERKIRELTVAVP
jgi:hypothetical protein